MVLDIGNLLSCPKCRGTPLATESPPSCAACGWKGRMTEGLADFVEDGTLTAHDQEELSAQKVAVRDYYENEDKVSCHWDRVSSDELPRLLGLPAGLVLDLGCGTGSAGAAFRRAGSVVVGVDLTVACLEVARRRLDGVLRANATNLPFRDGVFDAVVARGALHHLSDAAGAIREVRRILRPGGRALFVDPREFPVLEQVKQVLRKHDESFTDDHHAYGVREYTDLVAQHLQVEQVVTMHPLAIVVAVAMDLFPLPSWLPKRSVARALYGIDQRLDRTPLARGGHLVAVRAVRV